MRGWGSKRSEEMHRTSGKRRLIGPLGTLLIVLAAVTGGTLANARPASAALPVPPFTQCPRVGWDTSCAILIYIDAAGTVTVIADAGQGPFDGVEDTLIGVQNDSAFGIASIDLAGPGAFAFEPPPPSNGADGLCAGVQSGPSQTPSNLTTFYPPPAGCPFGPTYYEGPNTLFSNYSTGNSGTVNFTGNLGHGQHGLAAGASAYFSLEGKIAPTTLVVQVDPLITATGTTFSPVEGT